MMHCTRIATPSFKTPLDHHFLGPDQISGSPPVAHTPVHPLVTVSLALTVPHQDDARRAGQLRLNRALSTPYLRRESAKSWPDFLLEGGRARFWDQGLGIVV